MGLEVLAVGRSALELRPRQREQAHLLFVGRRRQYGSLLGAMGQEMSDGLDIYNRLHGKALAEATETTLQGGDTETIRAAYTRLLRYHEIWHSRNRPPDLNCTGCAIWPVILKCRRVLGIGDDEAPPTTQRPAEAS